MQVFFSADGGFNAAANVEPPRATHTLFYVEAK